MLFLSSFEFCMGILIMNTFKFSEDEEHRAITVVPANSEVIKTVKLVYYFPHVFMPMHSHKVSQFSSLVSGQAIEKSRSSEVENQIGVVEYKPLSHRHSNVIGPYGAFFLSVNIDSEQSAFFDEYGALNHRFSELSQMSAQWHGMSGMLMQPSCSQHIDYEERVLGIFSATILYAKKLRYPPTWLKLAEQALNESDMSIEQIAVSVGVHRVHLSRIFQTYFGMSISQYRQRLALQKSISAILCDQNSISSASAFGGFSDQSHFTRTLKNQFNITPRQLAKLFSSKRGDVTSIL